MPGELFDTANQPADGDLSAAGDGSARTERKFIGVKFECCAAYARIYINREQTAYVGNCPRCAKQVRLSIGPDGTDARFFTVR